MRYETQQTVEASMLDLNHPQTKYIFEASALLDAVRAELLVLEQAAGSAEIIGRTEHLGLVLIPKLRALNAARFASSPTIAQALETLSTAIETLNHADARACLLDLEGKPGRENFGVWAI
jgi:hypothetical protein